MGFFEDIKRSLNITESVKPVFRAVWIGDTALYIEGVNSIKSYSVGKIELRIKSGEVVVLGEELVIKKYCVGDIAICGKVKSVGKI